MQHFSRSFTKLCDQTFPEIEIKMKTKSLLSPWSIKRIKNHPKENKNYMKIFSRKEDAKMRKITKTINIYLKKLKIFQKGFTLKIN